MVLGVGVQLAFLLQMITTSFFTLTCTTVREILYTLVFATNGQFNQQVVDFSLWTAHCLHSCKYTFFSVHAVDRVRYSTVTVVPFT